MTVHTLPQATASCRASSRALYLDFNRPDMTLDDDIRLFTSVLTLQTPKPDLKMIFEYEKYPMAAFGPT
jgi:hypothetical protein